MENNKETNRIDFLDIAKGLGMLLVIYAHILVEGPVNWYIYIFHMPLFFFISGMLYVPAKYKTCSALLTRRFHTLLVPYVIYSVITWCIWAAYSALTHQEVKSYFMPLLQTVLAQGSGGFLLHNVPLWFVTCLFVVEIWYYYLNKISNRAFLIILCILISATGYCMIQVFDFFPFKLLPWNIEVAFAVMIFYAAGNVFAPVAVKIVDAVSRKNIIVFILCTVLLASALVFIALTVQKISFGLNKLGTHPVLLYTGAFLGIFMTLIISCKISLIRSSSAVTANVIYYIKWIGRYSFRFMAVHVPIKGFLTVVVAKAFHTSTEAVGASLLFSGIVFVITLIITTLITIATNKVLERRKNRKGGKENAE